MKGIIVKGIAGFYYVKTENRVVQCKARGIFKKDGTIPYVGDEVHIEMIDDEEAVINEICSRKNVFIRPPIANVDCFIIVIAAANPDPNPDIIDRFLVMAEKNHTEIVLCINKIDLVSEEKRRDIEAIYHDIYPVVSVSGNTGEGIEELKKYLKDKKSALAGPSGAGKSTLLNKLQTGLSVETGAISNKTKRGKHTTRHVEIFQLDFGGMIFDTPGFTSFDILEADEEELQYLYPEISALVGDCKYDNCRHIKEPDCRIRDAVKTGKIHSSRYDSYVNHFKEIQERRKYY
ncbi:ribosome small subunit-dependent GTPase A [Sinanaerobacter chloroacetimidivorans]|jgi:ribosome biogenesis GTPase|uniref:Small ribosomal subunit biogenesis GTPase RsgA n=1 Tax=Sinanaerobacter chloroacetimidivorans TaxID=2818044 RepID=A0A8J8B3Z0_9FIRM|nr:ribosome small subunit-dependent GTPase A [Sinanaerobacter chloroacetimidivorans]MBR0600217.1 ribosome small subunit-dependent GTPase A [Sinanaerobacter chloroacetimidivorans]